jgi:peptidoglycan/LPS O-acetylase OafA/YrhL
VAFALSGSLTGEWGYLRVFFRDGKYVGASMDGWLAWASNFTVFLQDITTFLSTSHAITYDSADKVLPIPLHSYLALPISWTIALELYFYLLVPWLSKLSNQRLFCLMGLSLCLKLSTVAFPAFTRDPWNYRFFPFELCLFLAGFISYRIAWCSGNKPSRMKNLMLSFERNLNNHHKLILAAVWLLLAASIPILRLIPAPFDTLAIILIFAAILPLLFAATKRNRLDQSVGELSYPIYLVHLPLGWLIYGLLKHSGLPITHAPMLTGLGSICASIVLVKTIFPPLERFRMRFKH